MGVLKSRRKSSKKKTFSKSYLTKFHKKKIFSSSKQKNSFLISHKNRLRLSFFFNN